MKIFSHSTINRYWLSGVFLVVLSNIPLLSTVRAPRWDAYDEMWNYFRWLGSSLRQGYFPDFFPNILSGYPIGSNIQAGTYNIFYLLAAYTFPDSVLSINTIYLITQIVLFSIGYTIARSYKLNTISSLYLGLAIVASGFVIGHASHFSYIATATGLLGIFLAIRISLVKRYHLAFFIAFISVYHLFTAGYPTNILFGAQCLIIYWIILLYRNSEFRIGLSVVALGLIFGLIVSTPSLWHFFNLLSQSNRGAGLDIDAALFGSLPSYSLFNFFNPVWKMGFTEPTMERYHLLYLSIPLTLISLYYGIYKGKKRNFIITCILLVILFTILALGKNSPIPLRVWLAENSLIYRAGKFPSGEHRGEALFVIALMSAFGLQWFMDNWPVRKRWLITILALDFLVVMYGLKFMRMSKVDTKSRGVVAIYNAELKQSDQSILDTPRNCTSDGQTWTHTAIKQQKILAPNGFYWNAYTSLRPDIYDKERDTVKEFLCGPSRLYDYKSRLPHGYKLSIYSPGYIKFQVTGRHTGQNVNLVWADFNDGFWKLKINDDETQFTDVSAGLRGFHASNGDEVEMIYEGPLTRLWR